MRRLLATVNLSGPVPHAVGAAFLLFTLGVSARASAQVPSVQVSCEPVERELSAARAALDRTERELEQSRSRAADADSLRLELERREQELSARQAEVNSCQNAQQNLCTATGSFIRGLGAGRVQSAGLGECIDPGDQRALVEQFSGISNVSSTMAQFGAFSAGETDTAPRLGPMSGSKLEKLVARLFAQGNGSPLVYRRLLLEALDLVVPRSWAEIKKKPGNIERWFLSKDPLEESLVAEAHEGAVTKPESATGGEPAPLTTALQLVTAYERLARCHGGTPARDCARAAQLRQMLETSGPLVARRRIQDIWATECSSVTDGAVLAWLGELPRSSTSENQVQALAETVHSKLLTCFLRDRAAGRSFSSWLGARLPKADELTSSTWSKLQTLQGSWRTGSPTDVCARAVRALQTVAPPSECSLPAHLIDQVRPWAELRASGEDETFGFAACDKFAHALWSGDPVSIPASFPAPPTVDDTVRLVTDAPPTNVHRLRDLCETRVGSGAGFAAAVGALSALGHTLGENPALSPWFIDTTTKAPVEDTRASGARGTAPWLKSLTNKGAACSILELGEARCAECRDLPAGAHYDCSKLLDIEAGWSRITRTVLLRSAIALGFVLLVLWALRLRRAVKTHGAWLSQAESYLTSIGLEPRPDKTRFLFPSRFSRLEVGLPDTPAWERWGKSAALVRSGGKKLQDRDVNRAGVTAQGFGAQLALLVHEENVSPDLGAVRATLEWAARGNKAVHVLPVPWSRLKWSQGAIDLLELAEESSLRSNPFEVRGRVTTSSQFFNRERLVSGLLASAQAGHFTVVTGLRRFGKSSLALEVTRRLPGPSAYVDLAGFHHEIRFSKDPADAVDAILRFLCLQLLESARTRMQTELSISVPEGKMDATALTAWFRDFGRALAAAGQGKSPPPVLLILDEIEQAIGAAKELNHALDVFAILVGRLRNSLPGSSQEGAQRVGVLFCSALHPLLWSPLGTLAHQSLIGSFQYVAVPCLPEDAAASMMRGLGARQGIRFTENALQLLLEESQGVPLLLRRLGTAVLELYDPERAHQGALGAVEIGLEGVRAALEREESEGSPLRVWVESEIAEPKSPGGAVLRALAQEEWLPADELRRIAALAFREQFDITGVALALTPEEALRRAQEAAGVVLRMLGDSGLLSAHGDPTEPEGYELPNGVIRRILRRSARPSGHPPVDERAPS